MKILSFSMSCAETAFQLNENLEFSDEHSKTFEDLAKRHDSRLIKFVHEINGQGGTLEGLSKGIRNDVLALPELLISYILKRLSQLKDSLNLQLTLDNFGLDEPNQKERKLMIIPGFAASSEHLWTLSSHLGKRATPHPQFEKRRIKERVFDDATMLAEDTANQRQEIDICAHSRGGLVSLCALKMLQDQRLDQLVSRLYLLSPTSGGIRPEIAQWVKHLGIGSVEDLCPDSEAVKFWQELSPENRAKIIVVSQKGGDGFTSPEQSFVPGSLMFLTPHYGHQESVRNPSSKYFQLVRELLKN